MAYPALDAIQEQVQAHPADGVRDIDRQLAVSHLPPLYTALLYSLQASGYDQLEDDVHVHAAVDAARALAQPLPESPEKTTLLIRLRLLEADSPRVPAEQMEAAQGLVALEAELPPQSLDRACLLVVRSRLNAQLRREEEAAVDANTAWMLAHALHSPPVSAEAAYQLATVYARYGLLEEADPLTSESTQFDRSRHLDSQLGDDLYLRADILHRLGRDDEALATLAESRELSQGLHEDINVAFDDQRECLIRIKQGSVAIARERCMLAEAAMRKNGRIDMALGIGEQLAELDLAANDAAGALVRLNGLLTTAATEIPPRVLSDLYREKSNAVARSGGWREALGDLRKADELAAIAASSNNALRTERVRARVRAAMMQERSAALQSEMAEQRARAAEQERRLRQRLSISGVAGALACAVAYVMWWRARQEQKGHEKKAILLKEIHHRVKNNLQIVSSLLNLQARAEDREDIRAFAAASHSRIQSMALVHEQLYQSESPECVAMDSFLHRLVTAIALGQSPGHVQCVVNAQRIMLSTAEASACGLIVNEIVTNAFKHAYSPGDTGVIEVSLFRMARQLISLRIRDDGKAAVESPKRGFGISLVKILVSQLEGRCEIVQEKGLLFSMCFESSSPS
jgi:two-component sensor histidine kinase